MSKAKELKTTTNLVKQILTDFPQARNSDDFLYYKVCERTNDRLVHLSFSTIMLDRKRYGFPAFESVRRARQKIQANYPELAGCSKVKDQRMLNIETFREYARGQV